MLGALFRVRQEFRLQLTVFFRCLAALHRAGQGARHHLAAPLRHQNLRRRPDDLAVFELQEVHVRRGVQRPQRAVEIEGAAVDLCRQPLRKDHLDDVTRRDVLLRPLHGRAVAHLIHRCRDGHRDWLARQPRRGGRSTG